VYGSFLSSNAILTLNQAPVADAGASRLLYISSNGTNATVILEDWQGSKGAGSSGLISVPWQARLGLVLSAPDWAADDREATAALASAAVLSEFAAIQGITSRFCSGIRAPSLSKDTVKARIR
jgi:hypothetical protein